MFCLDVFPLFVYLCGMERLHPDTTPEHKAALLLPYVSSHCVCSLALCISTLTFGQLRHRIVRLSSGVHTPSPGPSPPPSNQNHSHKCSLLPSALFRIMTWSPVWNDNHMNMWYILAGCIYIHCGQCTLAVHSYLSWNGSRLSMLPVP